MNLEIKNGNFSYTDGNPILKDINLKIDSGEIFTILGQNGIGKTTLLKCINGVLKWNSGEVFIDNKKVTSIKDLKDIGIKKTIMLTGDLEKVSKKVGKDLDLDEVYTNLLPQDKVSKFEEIIENKKSKGNVVFVGDGINDAPVLARADVGIAMGAMGSDAAIEAADVVIMTDEPSKIVTAIKSSKRTMKIAMQNISLAFGIKAIVLILSALGIADMWMAVFADTGVTILAVLNSFRALKIENN